MYKKVKISSIYDFSKLIHDEAFGALFSQVIMNEYYKYLFRNTAIYETENISISEVYTSFLYTISIYERDFSKKIHDTFLRDLSKMDQSPFDKSNDKDQKLLDTFDKLVNGVLHEIITNENNIFQSLIYKIYLFKLSLLD